MLLDPASLRAGHDSRESSMCLGTTNIKGASLPQCPTHLHRLHQHHNYDKSPNNKRNTTQSEHQLLRPQFPPSQTVIRSLASKTSPSKPTLSYNLSKMHYKVAALLSAATFSLCAFALPPPPPPLALLYSDVNFTTIDKRIVTGWCGVHITQYQKNEGPVGSDGSNSEYRLDVSLYDAAQDPMGSISLLSLPGGNYEDIHSQLPDTLDVLVGGTDDQPIRFRYGGQAWTSADGQCRVGAYDSGIRNMDCGFSC